MTEEIKKKPENPFAFPFTNETIDQGMTLRDYFAIRIFTELIKFENTSTFEEDAKRAYEFADFMLAEREVNNGRS